MQAVWLENGALSFRDDVELCKPLPGEAVVRVRIAGVCATDLEMVKGYYPFLGVIGHEFVGDVVDAPEYPAWVGRRVVGEINITCGVCSMCRSGRSAHCEQRSTLGISQRHGVFAEYTTLPLVNLHRVPDSLSDDAAVFTEPLAAALQILEQLTLRPSDRVLIVGAGRLGQLVAQVLSLTGCDLRVVARHPRQRELLSMRGIQWISEENIATKKFDLVVEATGATSGFTVACRAVRPRGNLVLKSTYAGDVSVNLSSLVVDEVTLIGSRCGPFQPALRLLDEGRVDPRPLIEERFPLREALQAFEAANQPGALKILLEIG
jgi:threonine dehydrogenase-like Zn-dependent dehydrogenase